MKSRVKASERAVARGKILLGLMEEEDEGNGLEFDFLALYDRPDDLLPRPLLLSI